MNNIKCEEILNNLKFTHSAGVYSDTNFTRQHIKCNCWITNKANKERIVFTYQYNPDYSKITLKDCLYSLMVDFTTYECGEYSAYDLKLQKALQKNVKKVRKLFSDEQLSMLEEYFQDY